jgi:CheY-like chemotaxis protein
MILVADDDRQFCKFLETALRDFGLSCDIVHTGKQAMEKMRSGAYECVLLDILMPERDGLEVLRDVAKEKLGGQLRIIAMSGGGSAMSGFHAIKFAEIFGAEAVLYKPFSIEDLQAALGPLVAAAS